MSGSGWRRGGDLCAGSGVRFDEMEKSKVTTSVWGPEEAFLSPPDCGGPLAVGLESEESSEDCDDYISGLAEEIAQSMLQEDEEVAMKSPPWGIIGALKPARSGHQMASSPSSPQSTLAGMEGYNWEARSPGGNMGGSSGVSSPTTPQEGGAVDVLYAELLCVKLEDQVKLASEQQMLSLQQQIIQRPTPLNTAPNALQPDNLSPLDKLHDSKSSKGGGQQPDNYLFRGGTKLVGAAWGVGPTLQQSNGGKGTGTVSTKRRDEGLHQYHQFSLFASNMESNSSNRIVMGTSNRKQQAGEAGMRAVFLGSPASRECGGTGVFLPRRPQDSKRKPACSTALVPSRIVNALNLRIEDTLPSPHRRDFPSSNSHWRRNSHSNSRRSKPKDEISPCYFPTSHPTTLQQVAPDISLPSEWTY